MILTGDGEGTKLFDRTVEGFWRSMFAAVLVLPGHAYMTWLALPPETLQAYGYPAAIIDLLIYGIVWLAYPIAMVHWARALDREAYLLDYLVPYNWMSVPIAYLFVGGAALAATGVLPAGAAFAMNVFVYAAAIFALIRLACSQLRVPRRTGFAIVLFDFVLTVAIVAILQSFAGR